MPWNVSGFCPQTLAFAPNVEHWDMRSLDKPLLIWPTSRTSCKLRSHIADGLTMTPFYPGIGEALMGILQDETSVNFDIPWAHFRSIRVLHLRTLDHFVIL